MLIKGVNKHSTEEKGPECVCVCVCVCGGGWEWGLTPWTGRSGQASLGRRPEGGEGDVGKSIPGGGHSSAKALGQDCT